MYVSQIRPKLLTELDLARFVKNGRMPGLWPKSGSSLVKITSD